MGLREGEKVVVFEKVSWAYLYTSRQARSVKIVAFRSRSGFRELRWKVVFVLGINIACLG